VKLPEPNLGGDYRESCVVCLHGTDTGLAFEGEPEWVLAGMRVLGIPDDQARIIFAEATGAGVGMVPDHDVKITLRACAACAKATGTAMTVGLIATGVPCYGPRQ
jgi:hypothetical protein